MYRSAVYISLVKTVGLYFPSQYYLFACHISFSKCHLDILSHSVQPFATTQATVTERGATLLWGVGLVWTCSYQKILNNASDIIFTRVMFLSLVMMFPFLALARKLYFSYLSNMYRRAKTLKTAFIFYDLFTFKKHWEIYD